MEDIHVAILKKNGYQVSTSQSKTLKGSAKVKIGINIPFIHKTSLDLNGDAAKTINKKNIELDPEDVNDIITSLDEVNFQKIIVIEDFHYLPEQTQIDFSVALKAFHESSKLCFIIVGVWLEEDKLTTFNGDLAGRVVSINADRWDKEDVYKLFENSEKLLNIKFDEKFKSDIVEKCNGSIFFSSTAMFSGM